MNEIRVTKEDASGHADSGVAFLEQDDLAGTTKTLIVTTKQLSEIGWFVSNPDSKSLHISDEVLGTVTVKFVGNKERYTIEQAGMKLYGNRLAKHFGFAGFPALGG